MNHDDDNPGFRKPQGSARQRNGAPSYAAATSLRWSSVNRYETGPEHDDYPLCRQGLAVEATIAHYAALYDCAPVGYFRLNRRGVIVEANLAGAGLLGAPRTDLLKRRMQEFVAPDMHAGFAAFLKKVFAGASKETSELRFLDSGGNPFVAHLEANAEKTRSTCRLVLCEVDERRQTELNLIESEERFRLMADSAPVLIWITGTQCDYLWFNRMWLDFTGSSLEEELGSGWTAGVHPDDLSDCLAKQEAAFAERRPFSLEYRLRNDSGCYHDMLAHGVPRFSPAGRFLGYIGTCTDISERKAMEEALRHSRQMLRHLVSHQERVREDERKRIARELHDDLGQNLLALRIDVSMLDHRTAASHPRLNERVRMALDHIDTTMKAVRAAINNLRPTVLDLGLMAALEWQVQEFRRRSAIGCTLDMEEDVALDDNRATALFRIVQESLNNVIRHAQASAVRIALRQERDILVLRVSDNGIGMYPDCRRKANSFGLVGIEERINALGGRLDIEGDPSGGTTLVVSLPLLPS